jgi:hypothetical protein
MQTPNQRKALPDGVLHGRMYVGKGCFAGYDARFTLSYTYLGPANLLVYNVQKDPKEWSELAEHYQREGLDPNGDPFDSTTPFTDRRPASDRTMYRMRFRKIDRCPKDILVVCHLQIMASGQKGGKTWMFYFEKGSEIVESPSLISVFPLGR